MNKATSAKAVAASIARLPQKLYELLNPLTPEERSRVVQATFLLFGESIPSVSQQSPASAGTSGSTRLPGQASGATPTNATAYFAAKGPNNKGEELAVAARLREESQLGEIHTQDELRAVIVAARRNFDKKNFWRDIKNAKNQSKLFNKGTDRDQYTLSYYGQQYVDTLPDREAVAKLKKPKGNSKSKGGKKKTA